MKKVTWISLFVLALSSCSKDPSIPTTTLPGVSTSLLSLITQTTATSGGIINTGGESVTSKGVCWGTSHSPTTANSKTTDGTGSAAYVSVLTGLSPATTYFVRTYAINSSGTGYGNEMTFTTLAVSGASIPSLTTDITTISRTTATGESIINSDGGGIITAKGVCWSTSSYPTISNSVSLDGSGSANFNSSLTGLSPFTKYHARAYATNSAGTGYGNDISFTTLQ